MNISTIIHLSKASLCTTPRNQHWPPQVTLWVTAVRTAEGLQHLCRLLCERHDLEIFAKSNEKKELQNGEYVLSFERASVTCAGCRKKIHLDSRNGARYYVRAFRNHKEVCSGVRDGMVGLDLMHGLLLIDLLNLTVL